MSTAFRNKGIASTKKECKDDKEKSLSAIKKKYTKQVKSLRRKNRILQKEIKTNQTTSKV